MKKRFLPLLVAILPSVALAQTGASWSSPSTGTLAGSTVTLSNIGGGASVVSYNLALADYSAAPLATTQECVDYNCPQNWTADFSPAVNGLTWYGKWIRGFDSSPTGADTEYTFSQPFVILSGFSSASIVGNTLVLPATGFHHGIIRFTGPVTTLSSTNTNTGGGFQVMTLGQLVDPGVGPTFCDPAVNNSTGLPTLLAGSMGTGVGSGLHLDAWQGPPNQFGYVLIGSGVADPGLPLSNGNFCLAVSGGNAFGRYNVVGGVLNSVGQFDSNGVLQNAVGTSTTGSGFDVPTLVPSALGNITTGSTWHFQLWYREAGGASNFSNGLTVDF